MNGRDPVADYLAKYGDPDDPVARYLGRSADPDEEEQGPLSRAMRFLGQGATQAVIGASKVNPLTYLVPGQRGRVEQVEERHEELKRDPEGALENISYYSGRLAPELLGATGSMRAAGSLGLKGIGRALAGNVPPSATFAADKESSLVQSDNPLARFAGEYAANLAGEGLFAAGGRALRALRKPSETIAENVAVARDAPLASAAPEPPENLVYRTEEPGVTTRPPSAKPQGLYLEGEAGTLGADLGGERRAYKWHPENPLDVTGSQRAAVFQRYGMFRGSPVELSAGIKAARRLLGEDEFQRLASMDPQDLGSELAQRYPDIEWSRYYDDYERIEAVAGIEARRAGYDAISDIDEKVALLDSAISPSRPPSETIGKSLSDLTEGLRGRTAPGAREILEEQADQQRRALNVAKQADVDPDEFVNVSKFGLDPDGEDRLRAAVRQAVAEEGLAPKEVVPNRQTIAEAFGLDPGDILKQPAKRLNRTEMLAARNYVRTNIEEIDGLASQLKDSTLPLPEKERIVAEIARREEMNNRLLGHFVQARSEAGRNLQSLKIIAQHTTDPLTWYEQAAKQLKGRPLTDTMRKDINKLLESGDQAGLVDYVANLRTATPGEKLASIWKAGLLTSPTTHMANFIGNTTMAFLESAKDVPGVVFDRLLGAVTGLETKSPSVRGLISDPIQKAGGTAARRSGRFLTDALKALKLDSSGLRQSARSQFDEIPALRGIADEGLDKVDQIRRVKLNNAFFDAYTNSVFRLLGEGDAVFSQAAAVRSLREQARLEAKKGLGTVQHLLENPTDEMVLQAIADAEYATFRDRTRLGRLASGIKNVVGTASEAVIPFTQTPSSIATKVIVDFTPVGGMKAVYDLARRSMSDVAIDAPFQRKIVDALGRSTVGSAPLALGAYLMGQGRVTLDLPDSESERAQFWAEGKQPWSIKIDGEWRSMERVSPAGNLFMTGAGIYQAFTEQGLTAADRATGVLSTSVRMATQQPMVTGTKTVLDIATDKEFRGIGKWAGGLASSVIPAGVRAIARGVDPTIREPEGIAQQVQASIPFASKSLPARIDALGGEVRRPSGVVGQLFDPFKSSPDKLESDDLLRAMNAAGIKIGGRDKREGESPEAYEARQRREGQELRANLELLESYMTADISPEMRKTIQNAIQAYRSQQTEQAKYMEMVQ